MARTGAAAALFRREALSASRTDWLGGALDSRWPAASWFAAAALAALAALVAGMFVGSYARKDSAPGYLVPTVGLATVRAARAGTVEQAAVREGDVVSAGDPLLTVGARRGVPASADVDAVQLSRLEEDLDALARQLTAERTRAAAARNATRERLLRLDRQRATARARLADAREQVELRERDWTRLQALAAAHLIAAAALDDARASLLAARLQAAGVEGEWQRLGDELAAVRAELEDLPARLSLRLEELELRRREVQRQMAEVESRRELVLRAPVAGRVAALTAHVGMAVEAGQPLLTLLPLGAELEAELLVPAHAIGFVHKGQAVRLRYDAFPHTKFGLQPGAVRAVSLTVIPPPQQHGPIRSDGPVFRVQVALESQAVTAYGEPVPLQPGLTLTADILRERRRIVEWVFEPLIAMGRGL